jgi:hypothetical protein
VFERKVLRRIYGPVQDNGAWRSRYNDELYTLFKQPKLTTVIKIGRLHWAGHIQHMGENEMPKLLLNAKPIGRRKWEGQEQGCKKSQNKNMVVKSFNTEEWRMLLEEAETLKL